MKPEEKITLLKQAWKEVFGVDEVADDADFFEEGETPLWLSSFPHGWFRRV